MVDPLIFGDREAEFLKELVRQKVRFMIVGLSAAALQGAPVVTQDIDLWFHDLADPGIKKALKKVRGSYILPIAGNPPMFAGEGVELFDIVMHMHGLGDYEDECENTIRIPIGRIKVLALKLERIIASKKATGRNKDKLVLKVLSDVLKTIQEHN
ncbi:MAG: hypothetical protein KAV42_04950 [Candidatus Krumholzibacteria bacterium]|nr:hypothetical protein [Candidatus Krumholzibacteria bacterium]